MLGGTFSHRSIRKYVIYFGTLFNNMYLTRDDAAGNQVQKMKVPIHYGPKEKFLARVEGNADLEREIAITLPRMSFRIVDFQYDPSRKLDSLLKVRATSQSNPSRATFQYAPVPYNLEFELYIMVKNAEDGTRLIEQIIPYFVPDYTSTLNLNDDLDQVFDVPLILTGTSQEDTFEGPFEQRRTIVWTLRFTMKGWMFGPTRQTSLINQVDINTKVVSGDVQEATESHPNAIELIITPGLTVDGDPTNNPLLTIDKNLIQASDNYGFIEEFTENL